MSFKSFLESSSEYISVYHVSPRSDMFKLRPTGHSKGVRSYIGKKQPGLFVAPKFRDAIAWAVSYVGGKKYDTQEPTERVKEKGGGRHGEKGPRSYRYLTIYEIKVPREVLNSSSYTAWWEPEFFISAEHLDKMSIVKSKTYTLDELSKIYSRSESTRRESYPGKLLNIERASKTNLAARFYLELSNLYNQALMKGKKPVFVDTISIYDNNHMVRVEIEKLMPYIFAKTHDFSVEALPRLSKQQEAESRAIYERVKRMIEGLQT